MSTPNNISVAKRQDSDLVAHNPLIDAAELARAMRSSATSFRALVRRYRSRGITDREIVAAMAASPHIIDALGRGRRPRSPPSRQGCANLSFFCQAATLAKLQTPLLLSGAL
jgi:hypothetical protein